VDVAAEDPVSGKNLAYTIHFYAASMGADLRGKVSTALDKGVAIFATEWGTCEYTGDGRLDLGETQAWFDFMEEHHISDSNWGVSDKEESCSALRPGASGSGGWSEGEITESGSFVRNDIREYNSVEPLASGTKSLSATSKVLMKKNSMRGPVPLAAADSRSYGSALPALLLAFACAAVAVAALSIRRRAPRSQSFLVVDDTAVSDNALSASEQ
jgi:aryl-phospho-beta-D-glucosidase BglC (GH1 family)